MSDADSLGRSVRLSFRHRNRLYRVGLSASAVVLVVLLGFPLYWMAANAVRTRLGVQDGGLLPAPDAVTLEQFAVITDPTVGQYLINSTIVTVGVVLTVLAISLVSGYGLARFEFPHKIAVARFLLLGYMFSPIVLSIPLYLIWDRLGLLNSYLGLILALSAISMPFSVWLMWKYIQTIPESAEASAWVAGASRWRAFVDIVIPQTKPAMIANAIFAFAIAWGDFTFAYVLMPNNDATTFPAGLFRLLGSQWDASWAEFMAMSLMLTLPPLVFAFFLQSYLLQGFKIRAL